ncbi:hypothetical protein BATR1942_16970 [Bacillus atrophaeus 1942]|uniref:Uncharacterized protein n=1 Tax=Bacillus atrophaeus (strain 1942) TaxID=720555 RepID=A0ABM5M2F8_BACA1|nr:hypothetical protein BATR1942_16970 [Bacillus atrophaeus 1942]
MVSIVLFIKRTSFSFYHIRNRAMPKVKCSAKKDSLLTAVFTFTN